MNNLPKVVMQQRRGRASNPRLLDHKSDALPLSHRATQRWYLSDSHCNSSVVILASGTASNMAKELQMSISYQVRKWQTTSIYH